MGGLKAHWRGALNGSLRGPPSKHLLTPKPKPFITLFLGPASTFAYLAFYIYPLCESSVPRSRLRFHGHVFVQDVCPIRRSFIYIRFGDLLFLDTRSLQSAILWLRRPTAWHSYIWPLVWPSTIRAFVAERLMCRKFYGTDEVDPLDQEILAALWEYVRDIPGFSSATNKWVARIL